MRSVVAEETARYEEINFDPDYTGDIDGSWDNMREIHGGKELSERDTEHLVALYDRGILYTDYWIGRILEELKRSGLYDETLIIVTSDHGDEFFEHGQSLYDELLRVPLTMRVPGEGQGTVVSDQVGLIDVLPTVLDLLGIDEDMPLQGRSLRSLWLGRGQAPRAYFGEAAYDSELLAVRTERWKYVSAGRSLGERREELFDLRQDSMEQVNRCRQEETNCARLREQARAWKQAQEALRARLLLPEGVPATVDETTAEQLRLLGYVE
jgi:arylsulfatase A-like enzyme